MPLMAKPGPLYSIFGNYSLVYLVVSRGLDQQSHSSSTVSEDGSKVGKNFLHWVHKTFEKKFLKEKSYKCKYA